MSKFIIRGGKPLIGGIRLGGAKNASYKIMIASLLCEGKSQLLNLAEIGDVEKMAQYTIELLKNEETHAVFAKNSRERAIKVFDTHRIVPQYLALYEKVLST